MPLSSRLGGGIELRIEEPGAATPSKIVLSFVTAPARTVADMILGPVSLLDCLVFVIFLIPQLLYQAGLFSTVLVVVKVLPFLSMSMEMVRAELTDM